MAGYSVRAPRRDDIPALVEVRRAAELAELGYADTTVEEVEISWRFIDVERDAWVAEDEHGRILAIAALRVLDPTQMRGFVAVHPDARGRGVGTRLADTVEARARERAADAPAGKVVTLSQGVGQHGDEARTLLEARGYRAVRRFWEMVAPLDRDVPEPAWPNGIRVEGHRSDLERPVHAALQEAFRDHWGFTEYSFEEWRAWVIEREEFDPSLWLIAMDGNDVAAASVNSVRDGNGWVNVLGVRKPWRRLGLGLALLHRSFRDFRERGLPEARLNVDAENTTGATRLYERAGMQVVRYADAYELVLRDGS